MDEIRQILVSNVKDITDGVLTGLQQQIVSLEAEIVKLKKDADSLRKEVIILHASNSGLSERVSLLELKTDEAEQYSRRNCLIVIGIPGSQDENTDACTGYLSVLRCSHGFEDY